MSTKAIVVLIMTLNSFMAAGGQLFLKLGMGEVSKMGKLPPMEFLFRALTTPFVLLGVSIYGISLIIWLFIISKVDLSFAYSLVALTFVFLLLFSRIFLHENISLLRAIGAALIILGIIFVSKS